MSYYPPSRFCLIFLLSANCRSLTYRIDSSFSVARQLSVPYVLHYVRIIVSDHSISPPLRGFPYLLLLLYKVAKNMSNNSEEIFNFLIRYSSLTFLIDSSENTETVNIWF